MTTPYSQCGRGIETRLSNLAREVTIITMDTLPLPVIWIMSLLSPCISFPIRDYQSSCHSALDSLPYVDVKYKPISLATHVIDYAVLDSKYSSSSSKCAFMGHLPSHWSYSSHVTFMLNIPEYNTQHISTKWSNIKTNLVHTHCYKTPTCLK
jgi:hypothetical protein